MKRTKHYDLFQNKLNDLEHSLKLVNDILKSSKTSDNGYTLKEMNLARSILIKNMYISVYEIFIQYTNKIIEDFIKKIFENKKNFEIINLLKENKNLLQSINLNFNELEALITNPNQKIKEKVISCIQKKEKGEKYLDSIDSLLRINIDNNLKEDISLFMSMRHCFIHNNGRVTKDWIKSNSKSIYRNNFVVRKKGTIILLPTDYIHLEIAIQAYSNYCKNIETHITRTPTEAGV